MLDKKLQLLAEHADFHVNINSVVGGGVRNPQDALTIGKRALDLGFSSTVGIIHDGDGQLQPLNDEERGVYHADESDGKEQLHAHQRFPGQHRARPPNDWRCRAGARYLYICEDGLVHYCSQQRGYPGIPLAEYTVDDIRREYLTEKSLRPALHGFLRASGFDSGLVERPATSRTSGRGKPLWRSRANQVALFLALSARRSDPIQP